MFSCMRNVPVILFEFNELCMRCMKPWSHTYQHHAVHSKKNFNKVLSNGSEYLCILIHLQIFKIPVFALSLWDIVCRLRKDVFNPF